MMKNHEDYKLNINEKHHIEKVDKPSGTAIKLANDIIKSSNYSSWILDDITTKNDINIDSYREGNEKGFHEIKYTSKNDFEINSPACPLGGKLRGNSNFEMIERGGR